MSKKFRPSGGTGVPNMLFNSSQNIDAIQKFNNSQIYTKGFSYTTQANTTNTFSPQLGGKCRQLHGIVLFFPAASINDDDTMSLGINEETIIDNVNWRTYSPVAQNGNAFKPNQMFEIRRALSGSDSVVLQIRSVNAHQLYITFYLSNS